MPLIEDPCPDVDHLLDFVEKRLTASQRESVRQHVEQCSSCLSEVATAMTGRDETTAPAVAEACESGPVPLCAPQIGRFQVLDRVGAGGMGEVYSAYDPQLNRRVAIKVLKASGQAVDQARFAREAQALARISHPNVVPIHEAGMHRDSLFIAMEFVEGETLKEWSNQTGRDRENLGEMLGVLVQAGEGLAAAHERGLVHRDFKPSNVLVGRDGRVRVVDFGVARSQDFGEHWLPVDVEGSPGDVTLTQTGYAVGTPAYMAPEQILGNVSAASDQFSFCVVAWEVLFRMRPFKGNSTRDLLVAIQTQSFSRPAQTRVPHDIEAALRRGLSNDPQLRFPNMHALLGELRRTPHPSPTWRRWAQGGGLVVALASSAGAWVLGGGTEQEPCTDSAGALAGVWDPSARERVRRVMHAAGNASTDAARRVEKTLDSYTRAWIESHREACEASRIRGELPVEVMELRRDCLAERRDDLLQLVEQLESSAAEGLDQAEILLEDLAPIESCQDLEYIRLPQEIQPEVDKSRRLLMNADALRAKGYIDASREMASMALGKILAHDVPCMQIEIYLALAKAALGLSMNDAASQAVASAHALRSRCEESRTSLESHDSEPWGDEDIQMAGIASLPDTRSSSDSVAPSSALLQLALPHSSPRGKDIPQWQIEWTQWVMETPLRLFLLSDGEDNYCSIHQTGDVRFLAGTINVDGNRTHAARTCIIPEGTALFFPAINEFHGAFDTKETEQKLRESLSCAKNAAGVLEIDGVVVADIRDYFSESKVFEVRLPKDNAFGVDESTVPGMRLTTSVSAGQYFFLEGLPVGTHHIRVTALNACANLQLIDHTVVVEPAQ